MTSLVVFDKNKRIPTAAVQGGGGVKVAGVESSLSLHGSFPVYDAAMICIQCNTVHQRYRCKSMKGNESCLLYV
jgi:hypothetical protein